MKARVRCARDGRGAGADRGTTRDGCFCRDLPIRDTSELGLFIEIDADLIQALYQSIEVI
jgi:hypothetical protein